MTGNGEVAAQATTDGANLVQFGASDTPATGVVSQSITTVIGQRYTLRFDHWANAAAPTSTVQSLNVQVVGANTLINRTIESSGYDANPVTQYGNHSFTFVANSTTTTISFADVSATTTAIDGRLDDVRAFASTPNITVFENTANGTAIGAAAALDVDKNDQFTYSLDNNASGRFAIDGRTGQITVANGSLLNYEANTSHSITIRTTDRAGAFTLQAHTINVLNVNEAPSGTDITITAVEDTDLVITAANFGFSDVDGNTLSSVRITTLPINGALYLDTSGDGLINDTERSSLTAGSTVSIVDITAGSLKFKPASDANGNNYASFTFQVVDNGGTANGGVDTDPTPNTMTINVTSVPDNPRGVVVQSSNVLLSDNFNDGEASDWIRPNGFSVVGNQLSTGTWNEEYRIAIWSDPAALAWADVSITADVSFGDDDAMGVAVRVQDTNNYVYAELDLGDGSTPIARILTITGGVASTRASISLPGAFLLQAANLTLTAVGNSYTFEIDGTTVLNTTITGFNAGTVGLTTHYQTDSSFDNVVVTQAQLRVNENAANGTIIGYAKGYDRDAGDTLTYSLPSNAGGRFAINSTTGAITVANSANLNFEAGSSYAVTVVTTDSTNRTTSETHTIFVDDVNEAPVQITLGNTPTTLTANGNASLVSGSTYQLTPNATNQTGTIWGAVNLSQDLTITTKAFFGANDGADGIVFAFQNQSATSMTAGSFGIGGNTSTFGVVFDTFNNGGNEIASDNAQFFRQGVTFQANSSFDTRLPLENLEDGLWRDLVFAWNSTSKTLTFTLDGAITKSIFYDVVANDWGGNATGFVGFGAQTGSLFNQQQVEIVSVRTGNIIAVAENSASGTVVGVAGAIDPDRTGTIVYSLQNNAGGRFAINSSTGVVTVANGSLLDYESNTSHNITIRATDQGGLFRDEVQAISVINVNEAADRDRARDRNVGRRWHANLQRRRCGRDRHVRRRRRQSHGHADGQSRGYRSVANDGVNVHRFSWN